MARTTGDIEREIAETRDRLRADLDELARRMDFRARLHPGPRSRALILAVTVIAVGAVVLRRSCRRGRS